MSKNINNKQNEKAFSSVSASVLHCLCVCVCVCVDCTLSRSTGQPNRKPSQTWTRSRPIDPTRAARARTSSRTPASRQDKGQRRGQTEVMSCVTRRCLIARKVSDTGKETESTSARAKLIVTLGVSCLSPCCAVLCLILESTLQFPVRTLRNVRTHERALTNF